MTGDELVGTIISGGDESALDDAGKALLRECFRGYPTERLLPLLRDSRSEVVKVGAWIVSELGVRGQPLLEEVGKLLEHEVAYVRFFAIDSVLSCSTDNHGDIVARVLRRLTDSESSVRWKATQFLMRASLPVLRAAFPSMSDEEALGLQLVTNEGVSADMLMSTLRSASPITRRFALAAAYRTFQTDRAALKAAASSDDLEIREIAERELEGT
jgi:hypothetical protein